MNGEPILGIVDEGRFRRLSPGEGTVRLTGMAMQAGAAPETEEISLQDYDGHALLIRGRDSGDWIYEAEIVETAGPILTMVVARLFGNRQEVEAESKE